jgi:DNA-binding beta-propeller fold protein YncE
MNAPSLAHLHPSRRLITPRALLAAAGLAALLSLGACASKGGSTDARMFDRPAEPGDVSGRMIVTISDADMIATAFSTGQLGTPADGAKDTLTVLGMPITEPQTAFAQVPVSNSVMGPPQALSVNSAGTTAFVVESHGPAAAGATDFAGLSRGTLLQMVSLDDPMNPLLVSSVFVGTNPSACSVSPDGALVAVVTRDVGNQLVIVPVNAGKLDQPLGWPLLGIDDTEADVTSVSWHPSGRFIAVCLPERDEVLFYEVSRVTVSEPASDMIPAAEPGAAPAQPAPMTGLAISPCGAPVKVGKFPYHGQFTPDGKHFITTDLQWQTKTNDYLLQASAGTLSVVAFDASGSAQAQHRVVSTANVGVSPEGLAISPDGKYVVAANLKRSFLPDGDARLESGSLTLLSLSESGQLSPVSEHDLGGMPEGISFDAAGNFVVVTLFRALDPDAVEGELAFWRLNRAAQAPTLEQAKFRVGVGRGPHGVLVVR